MRATEKLAVCEIRSVTKRFAGVTALDDVSFDVRPGEVHALLGENGAGKSTLIKILTGIYAPDGGDLLIDGKTVRLSNPHHARAEGITLVSQDVLTVPTLSVGRNVMLGRESRFAGHGRLSSRERVAVNRALSAIGVELDCDRAAGTLSVSQQRLVEFARALVNPGRVLLLDEPTAALSEHDSERLVQILSSFRDEGRAIVYVSHRLSEVMRLADRITVLRDGRVVGTFGRAQVSREELVSLMANDQDGNDGNQDADLATARPSASPPERPGAVRLLVKGLTSPGRFRGVDLTAGKGQIVGIAGVQGSGHGDVVKALAGVLSAHGRVSVDGSEYRLGRPAASFTTGIILVPADRRGASIIGGLSVRDNISLSRRIRPAARRLGLRWPRREGEMTKEYIDRLSIRPPQPDAQVGYLSGGNQQKVALARALEGQARILLIEEPTQGIDIHAKAEVLRLLRMFAARGGTVVVATAEFEELGGLADEVIVMCQGRVAGKLQGGSITYRNILSQALP